MDINIEQILRFEPGQDEFRKLVLEKVLPHISLNADPTTDLEYIDEIYKVIAAQENEEVSKKFHSYLYSSSRIKDQIAAYTTTPADVCKAALIALFT